MVGVPPGEAPWQPPTRRIREDDDDDDVDYAKTLLDGGQDIEPNFSARMVDDALEIVIQLFKTGEFEEEPSNVVVGCCQTIAQSLAFKLATLLVILSSAILLGLEADKVIDRDSAGTRALNNTILVIFCFEILIKIGASSSSCRSFCTWFSDGWNLIDVACVLAGLVALLVQSNDSKIQGIIIEGRMLRLFRVLKLSKFSKTFTMIVNTFAHVMSSASVWGTFAIGLLFCYIYAILAVSVFRNNDPTNFGDFPSAYMSLFRMMTPEGIFHFFYTQYYGCDQVPPLGNNILPCDNPSSQEFVAVAFFITFYLSTTIIIYNMSIAIVVEALELWRVNVLGTTAEEDYIQRKEEDKKQSGETRKHHQHTELIDAILALDSKVTQQRQSVQQLLLQVPN